MLRRFGYRRMSQKQVFQLFQTVPKIKEKTHEIYFFKLLILSLLQGFYS